MSTQAPRYSHRLEQWSNQVIRLKPNTPILYFTPGFPLLDVLRGSTYGIGQTSEFLVGAIRLPLS